MGTVRRDENRRAGGAAGEEARHLAWAADSCYGAFLTDPEGRLSAWNDGMTRFTGYRADEVLGRESTILFTEEDSARRRPEHVLGVARDEGVYEGEGVGVRKDGTRYRAHVVVSPVRDGRGALIAFAHLARTPASLALAERAGLVLDMLGMGVWVADPDGNIVFGRGPWFEFTGMSWEQTMGSRWLTAVHPDDREGIASHWRECLQSGEPYAHEVRMRAVDGSYRWLLSQAVPHRDPDGEIDRWVGTLVDIDAQRREVEEGEQLIEREMKARAEAERWAREDHALREALAAVSTPFTSREVAEQIVAKAMLATGADGGKVLAIDRERDRVDVVGGVGETPPGAVSFRYEGSLTYRVVEKGEDQMFRRIGHERGGLWPDGVAEPWRDWSMLLIPLLGEEGVYGTVSLFRRAGRPEFSEQERERAQSYADLTGLAFQKLRLLEEEERRGRELEALSESRARLMRGFAEDVRSSLSAARDDASRLVRGGDARSQGKIQESIRSICRSLDASLHLIDELLELARAQAGQIVIHPQRVHASTLVSESVDEFRAQAARASLKLEVDADVEASVVTDPARFRQVLGNLLSNAIKYTEQGGVTVRVAVRDDRLCVDVIDTGPGIPADRHEAIFEEFTRSDPGSPHGTGIGLSIARRVAHLLQGEITLVSEPGKGSAFTFCIPL